MLNCVVLCCALWLFSVVVFLNTMVTFSGAPLGSYQSGGVPNLEPLSKPILDAISQAFVMGMEKHIHSCKKEKEGKLDFLHVILLLSPPTHYILLK